MLNFYSGGDLGVFTVLLGPPVVPGQRKNRVKIGASEAETSSGTLLYAFRIPLPSFRDLRQLKPGTPVENPESFFVFVSVYRGISL